VFVSVYLWLSKVVIGPLGTRAQGARARVVYLAHRETVIRKAVSLEALAADVRCAWRSWRAAPAVTAVAVLSLALGIGANAAIFSVITEVMLRSLPVSDPERLVMLTRGEAGARRSTTFTPAMWDELRRHATLFGDLFAYGSTSVDLSQGGEARRVGAGFVTGTFFRALGVRSAAGRLLAPEDDLAGCPAVAVITQAFWRSHFGSSPAAVGASIPLDGHPFEIVGVTEPPFFGIEIGYRPPVWVPLCAEPIVRGTAGGGYRGGMGRLILARLSAGDSVEQARARIAAAGSAGIVQAIGLPATVALDLQPFARGIPDLRRDSSDALFALMAGVALVLLIACANVANLLLARASARRRETAVRLALGASRSRIVRQFLTESVLLSLAAAAAGLALARPAGLALVRLLSPPGIQIALDLPIDRTVLSFTTAVAVLTGVLFGLAPAWGAGRLDAHAAMRAGGRGVLEGGSRLGAGQALLVAQIALALTAVCAALLLGGSWRRLAARDPGFRPDHVVIASADIRMAGIADARQATTYAEALDRLRAIPHVASVSASTRTPIGNGSWTTAIEVEGLSMPPDRRPIVELNEVSERYFQTLGIPLRAGRDFAAADGSSAVRIAIVSERLARAVFGERPALGQRFRWLLGRELSPAIEIVGIAADTTMRSLRDDRPPIAYLALRQNATPGPVLTFAVRSTAPSPVVVDQVKSAFAEIDPRISLRLTTLAAQLDDSLHLERALGVLAGSFGILAVGLAAMGLYGVVSYTVARRRNEIGVRIALGAERGRILRMIFADVGWLLAGGVAIGMPLSLSVTRLAASLLYGVTPGDPAALAGAAALLAAAAMAAALLPARRAARLNPIAALREE
jgi:putative ABC transport system permease protein